MGLCISAAAAATAAATCPEPLKQVSAPLLRTVEIKSLQHLQDEISLLKSLSTKQLESS